MSKTGVAARKKPRVFSRSALHLSHGFTEKNKVRFVHCGKEFIALLKKQIDAAEHTIHLQTYIFSDDETGTLIADALIDATRRKVEVFLLVDGYASQSLSKEFVSKLRKAGIRFRFFEPLLKSKYYYFGRRLHHKIVVIDYVKAIVGSMNIANSYNDVQGEKAWLDVALLVEGEAALELHNVCCKLWTKKKQKIFHPTPDAKKIIDAIPESKSTKVAVRQNDWVYRKNQAYQTYYRMFHNAKKSISIVCSYFLPGKGLMRKLRQAVERGVKVRVVLAGVSDVKTAKYAERYLYRWMIRNEIELYEYQPTVLHAKFAVADGHFLTLGSYNLNGLSAYASIELNLNIDDTAFVKEIETEVDEIIESDCKKIDLGTYNTKLISVRQFLQWGAYQFLRVILKISTFYFSQKE
jgi:cardiolipin synthase A/B